MPGAERPRLLSEGVRIDICGLFCSGASVDAPALHFAYFNLT